MKPSFGLLLSSLVSFTDLVTAISSSSSAKSAHIYTFDSPPHISSSSSSSHRDISPETAQLLLDRRLGTNSRDAIGSGVTEDVIEVLNRHGGRVAGQKVLFASDADASTDAQRLGIVVEGLENGDFLQQAPELTIGDVGKDDLWAEMVGEDATARSGCTFWKSSKSGLKVEVQLKDDSCARMDDGKVLDVSDEHFIEQILYGYLPTKGRDAALVRFSFPKNADKRVNTALTILHKLSTSAAEKHAYETTILVLPPLSSGKQHRRRASPPKEEPLTASFPSSSESTTNSTLTSQISPFASGSNSSSPLPSAAAIPRCFATLNSCNSGTNNCSSHGTCVLVHKSNAGDSTGNPDCYSCVCKATPKGAGSKGVINWGGKACQKKDISTPFWLFAGLGITLMAIVGGGIGMLYTMGSETLPGVLGAGVGGPRASR